ncbi:MAG: ABC transporter permease [Planctomycetota bacterium]
MRPRARAPLCVREAALEVARRPVRSLLVLQAIILGSAAGIFPRAIYRGSREAALTRSGEYASDRVIVGAADGEGPVLPSWEAIDELLRERPEISAAAGIAEREIEGSSAFLLGADRRDLDARRLVLRAGRNFSEDEISSGAPVCILEAQAAKRLFPSGDPLEKTLELPGSEPLRVIGVLRERPRSVLRSDELGLDKDHALGLFAQAVFASLGVAPADLAWLNADGNVLVPWRRLGAAPRWLVLRIAPERVRTAIPDLQRHFALRGLDVVVYANVALQIFTAPELEALVSVSRDIFLLCLFMGVVVVANVALLSVRERRREIAIRRAEGATTADIVLQFLVESGVFCTAGAAIGVPLGILLAWARVSLDPSVLVRWAIPWRDVAATFAATFAGGLAAGIAPAWRAARLDPVEVFSRA